MNTEMEYGVCDICGFQGPVSRKYYHYGIKCECHSPEHFEFVHYCRNCEPKEPISTTISIKGAKYFIKTSILKRIVEEAKSKNIAMDDFDWFSKKFDEEVAAGTVLCLKRGDE